MAEAAAEAHADWQRRWFISLAVANGAGLGAVGAAIAGSVVQQSEAGLLVLRWALVPAAWVFAVGLFAGGALPYCWTRVVQHVGDWTDIASAELDAGGVTDIELGEGKVASSHDLIHGYAAHERLWSLMLGYCQAVSAGAFLIGAVWLLASYTKWAFVG